MARLYSQPLVVLKGKEITMVLQQQWDSEVYQGQFGEFTITDSDLVGVIVYRSSLMIAALSFAIGSGLVLWQPG